MSSVITQQNVDIMFGTSANRPPIATTRVGTIYNATDTLITYEAIVTITGVKSWMVLGGSGSFTNDLPKYFVSPPGLQPTAQYTTITQAIAAAVADGHTAAAPAAVLVYPGTYVENLVLFSGIDVVGFGGESTQDLVPGASPSWGGDIIISGNVTLDPGYVSGSLVNIALVAASGAALALGANANLALLNLHGCRLQNTSATIATVTGGPTASPQVNFDRSQLRNTATVTGQAVLQLTSIVNVNGLDTSFRANVGTDATLVFSGGTQRFERCIVTGTYIQLVASTTVFVDTDTVATGATAITTLAGGTVTWTRGSITGATAGVLFAGAGTVTFVDNFTLPKYWVGKANRFPFAPYNTITAAITAAVADGHSVAAPADIYIMSGTYVENVTLFDGINLIGLGGTTAMDLVLGVAGSAWTADVTLTGALTLDAAFITGSVTGMRCQSNTAGACLALGANATIVSLGFRNCWMSTNQATPVITGSPTGGNGTPTLFFDGCRVFNSTTRAGPAVISMTTACNVQGTSSSFQSNAGSDTAFSWSGGLHQFRNCIVFGNIAYLAQSTADIFINTDITLTTNAAVTFGATASTVTVNGGSIKGAVAGTTFSGTGTINLVSVISDANGVTIPSTVTSNTYGLVRGFIEQKVGAANKVVTNVDADLYLFDCTAGVRNLTLPVLATVPKGTKIRMGVQAGALGFTMTPNGAELINGANAPAASAASITATMTAVAGSTSWWLTTG